MTSHYNVWWNGDQSIREGEKSLKGSVKDDYTGILPVFNYGTKENALSLNSAIKLRFNNITWFGTQECS